jgi:hypothetical protein
LGDEDGRSPDQRQDNGARAGLIPSPGSRDDVTLDGRNSVRNTPESRVNSVPWPLFARRRDPAGEYSAPASVVAGTGA